MCCAGCGKITFIKLLGLSMSIMHVAVAIYINKNILQFGRKKEPFLVFSLHQGHDTRPLDESAARTDVNEYVRLYIEMVVGVDK